MQLNEIIEEYGLKAIARKTKIPEEYIEKISHRDFYMITEVKALGFISIIAREFEIDLSSLKKECREYYSMHKEKDESPMVIAKESEDHSSKMPSKVFSFVALCAVGYGAWYFFVDTTDTTEMTVQVDKNNSSLISSIMDKAQKWLGNTDDLVAIEENASNHSNGVWSKEENKSKILETKVQDKLLEKNNSTSTEEEIVREAKKSQDTLPADVVSQTVASDNNSSETNDSKDPYTIDNIMGLNPEKNSTDSESIEENASQSLDTEVPSLASTANTDDTPAVATEVIVKKPEVAEVASEKPKVAEVISEKPVIKETKAVSKVVVFSPQKKVWVGYTNLRTMKREAKVASKNIDFDTDGQSWILVTAHGGVLFEINSKVEDVSIRGKNYFLIKNGTVKSISKKEFQKLNKSKVW